MHKLFGEILAGEGKITKKQLKQALGLQKDNPERKLGEIMVTLNFIKYDDIIRTLKDQFRINGEKPEGIEKWLSQDEIDRIVSSLKNKTR